MSNQRASLGLVIMVFVAMGGAVDALVVRLLAGEIPAIMIGFTRVAFGLLAILPLLVRRPQILRSQARWGHVFRAVLKLGSLVALFAALQSGVLATVTAIGFVSPLFVALGAWAFLREKQGVLRILGLITGFAGMLVILGPALGLGSQVAMTLALVSALLTASIQLMLKVMGARDSALTLVAWNLIISVPIAFLVAIWVWTWPTPFQWSLLALQGVLGTASQLGVTRALQLADASLITPVDFLRLPFVAVMAWLVFSEVPPLTSWIGGALIFVAILVLSLTNRKDRRHRMVDDEIGS